jgi:hypothetical protein
VFLLRGANNPDLLCLKLDNLSLPDLAAFAQFHMPVNRYLPIRDGILGHPATAAQPRNLQQIAELDKFMTAQFEIFHKTETLPLKLLLNIRAIMTTPGIPVNPNLQRSREYNALVL